MQHSWRPLLVFVVLGAVSIFIWTLAHAVLFADNTLAPQAYILSSVVVATHATTTLPVRLQIPALHIDAQVQYVGVNAKGEMGVPNNFTDVAWYKNGVRPGEEGSAVMDGHVDNGLALPGVFKHLQDIKIGDDVFVKTHDGATLHFAVTDIEVYAYKVVPMEIVFAAGSVAHLNLITCVGAWVRNGHTYDHRIVVYTTLVGS